MNGEEEVEEKAAISREVFIPVDSITLPGELSVPGRAEGLVLFAHGSGSSRHSPLTNMWRKSFERPASGHCS
jgi:putative phosphoribosyl transferase